MLYSLGVLGALAVGFLLGFTDYASGADWSKEPSGGGPLEQRARDPQGKTESLTKWDEGVFEVKAGATADPRRVYNRAQAEQQAKRAAWALAIRKLAEVVEGVQIDGTTVVRNAMHESSEVRATVHARIQGARIVKEEVSSLSDGSIWAEVTVA